MTLRRNRETQTKLSWETILILQENDEIIAAFQKTIATTGDGFELKVWRNATSQCAGCEEYFHSGFQPLAWKKGERRGDRRLSLPNQSPAQSLTGRKVTAL
jgi:hypothetical protein